MPVPNPNPRPRTGGATNTATMTTPNATPFLENVPAAAARVLEHKNWTGYTLAALIDYGRVLRSDTRTIRDFVRAALGDAATIEGVRAQILIAEHITNAKP